MEDVFSFDDFLSKNGGKKVKPIIFDENEEDSIISGEIKSDEIEDVLNTYNTELSKSDTNLPITQDEYVVDEEEPTYSEPSEYVEEFSSDRSHEKTNESAFLTEDDNGFYKLYQDKNEEFTCDIMVEGSSPEETYARIIIESENWSLIFPGEIRNGKCIVPIKKLNILKEGEVGNIKLEVVAEGNLFTPWENQFKVKLSKKVTVSMNESNKIAKKPVVNNKVGVRVNVK